VFGSKNESEKSKIFLSSYWYTLMGQAGLVSPFTFAFLKLKTYIHTPNNYTPHFLNSQSNLSPHLLPSSNLSQNTLLILFPTDHLFSYIFFHLPCDYCTHVGRGSCYLQSTPKLTQTTLKYKMKHVESAHKTLLYNNAQTLAYGP